MKVYASISGGKDSLAALITHIERGGQCDGAIYCRIMFDDETSAEVPEHEDGYIANVFRSSSGSMGLRRKSSKGNTHIRIAFISSTKRAARSAKYGDFHFCAAHGAIPD